MAIVDRIKHDAPTDDLLVWKFPSEELSLGAQLIVNQSQDAVFVKGGQALDVFGPGTHTLASGNLPFLNKLINFPFGGKTPFTAEVWYVNKTAKRDMKWGTKGPIQIIDPTYQFPVSVRAFGRWGLRVSNSQSFVNQLVGTLKTTDAQRIEEFFIGEIVQRLSDALAKYFIQENISVFQVSAKLNDLSVFTQNAISPEFDRFGIEVVNFNVERISIPDEEQKKFQEILGKRMEIDQISKANVGQAYATMRTFDTLESAAKNSGGAAGNLLAGGMGLGMGVGAGFPIGQQMGQAMNVQPQQPPAQAPVDPMAKLQKMKQMLDAGLITQQEYDDKKKEILSQM
jgi:membrane protease subunit (stomatin/prohibitin family)